MNKSTLSTHYLFSEILGSHGGECERESGKFRRVVCLKLIEVSDVLIAFIIRAVRLRFLLTFFSHKILKNDKQIRLQVVLKFAFDST
jgi:hypothetical protein